VRTNPIASGEIGGGQQIGYTDEEPEIREKFEAALAKRGLVSDVPEEAYTNRAYEWDYGDDGEGVTRMGSSQAWFVLLACLAATVASVGCAADRPREAAVDGAGVAAVRPGSRQLTISIAR